MAKIIVAFMKNQEIDLKGFLRQILSRAVVSVRWKKHFTIYSIILIIVQQRLAFRLMVLEFFTNEQHKNNG